eukprot:COSAG06_NODE_42152_length_384_cov_0.905263_1_plen_65_part_10
MDGRGAGGTGGEPNAYSQRLHARAAQGPASRLVYYQLPPTKSSSHPLTPSGRSAPTDAAKASKPP